MTLIACSNDDDNNTPEEVNEEEVITTLTLVLTDGDGNIVTLISSDPDGDGPQAPTLDQTGQFTADTEYLAVISFTNINVNPVENVTEEVLEEADEHQVFYIPSGSLNLTAAYNDEDDNGNPLGILTTMNTGAASNGTLNVVLRHEPNKPNNGTLADAGGETDISVTFDITIN